MTDTPAQPAADPNPAHAAAAAQAARSRAARAAWVAPEVVDALDCLEDLYEQAQYQWDALRAVENLVISRQERIWFSTRWADVPVAHQLCRHAGAIMSTAGQQLDQLRGRALSVFVQGVLAAALAVQAGRTPHRQDVLAVDPDARLGLLRADIGRLIPVSLAPGQPEEVESLTFSVTSVVALLDAISNTDLAGEPAAVDEPLDAVLNYGLVECEQLPPALAGFAEVLRAWICPPPPTMFQR